MLPFESHSLDKGSGVFYSNFSLIMCPIIKHAQMYSVYQWIENVLQAEISQYITISILLIPPLIAKLYNVKAGLCLQPFTQWESAGWSSFLLGMLHAPQPG